MHLLNILNQDPSPFLTSPHLESKVLKLNQFMQNVNIYTCKGTNASQQNLGPHNNGLPLDSRGILETIPAEVGKKSKNMVPSLEIDGGKG